MKKLLLVLAIICLVVTSCNRTPNISLSVDKSEISANGEDIATFKVICNDEEDITKECRFFIADSNEELVGTTFSTTEPNTYSFYATYKYTSSKEVSSNNVTVTATEVIDEGGNDEGGNDEGGNDEGGNDEGGNDEGGNDEGGNDEGGNDEGGNEENENPVEGPIVLTASADTIIADDTEVIKFTVMQDTVDVTSLSKIFVNDNLITGNEFKTKVAGSYKVLAKKNDTIVSNEITFFAKEVKNNEDEEDEEKPIELTAEPTTITANGMDAVTFTVTQDGNDVTNEATVFVNGGKLNGNIFTTYTAGTYTAYAEKNTVKSNEITITVKPAEDLGKSIVFAEGVTLTSGWYDVNKVGKGDNGDINMCWSASSSNIIQWWQDRYVADGNTLPEGAVTGPGANGTYELALMDMFHSMWNNNKGGNVAMGIEWYFTGRNIEQYASEGSIAYPLDENTGGYYKDIWKNQILPNTYHEYSYVITPALEFNDLICQEYNNYYIWGGGAGLNGVERLRKFSEMVVEFMSRGMMSLTISLNSNGGAMHATTLWGYEIDNATGLLTKIWITDSDDLETEPKSQILHECAVSYDEKSGKIKFTGIPRYGAFYAMALYPVSKYGSR